MIKRRLSEIGAMCGGELHGKDTAIQGVSTDTRSIAPGNLYVPLKGANFDGHDFVEQAVAQGAAACLWQKGGGAPPENIPCVLVGDCLTALQSLAAAYREQLSLYLIAITGSNGKTSTKDMLASILSRKYRTKKNAGNKNNHIGLPLTILDFDEDTEMGVVEMGMSALFEIELLTKIARPDMALITNIGEAHLADVGSRENIVTAKLEILKGLKPEGRFITDIENPDPRIKEAVKSFGDRGTTLSYESPAGDYYPENITAGDRGMGFTVHGKGLSGAYQVPMSGKYQVYNAMAAAVAALKLGMSEEDIRQGILDAAFTGQRGEIIPVGNHILIDDTYKSNPAGLKAAIESLIQNEWSGRKAVFLGDMRDLGKEEETLHREIGKLLKPTEIDYIITIGHGAKNIHLQAQNCYGQENLFHFAPEEKEKAGLCLLQLMEKGPLMVLVKGARAQKLETVVAVIKENLG